MSEQMLLEYGMNAAWQVPLIAGAAWLFVRAARLGPLGEHRVWLGVLALCVLLPLRGIAGASREDALAQMGIPGASSLTVGDDRVQRQADSFDAERLVGRTSVAVRMGTAEEAVGAGDTRTGTAGLAGPLTGDGVANRTGTGGLAGPLTGDGAAGRTGTAGLAGPLTGGADTHLSDDDTVAKMGHDGSSGEGLSEKGNVGVGAWGSRTRLQMRPRMMRVCGWIYGSVVTFALLRLGQGWLAAHRLLGASEKYAMEEAEAAVWSDLGEKLKVELPEVRSSKEIWSPVVVGIVRPVLLLPEGFRACEEGERRAALCHELAHIKRRDCVVNALCQVMAVPLVWHPLMHEVQRMIARTREMVCDGIAAREMCAGADAEAGRMRYAKALVGLARKMMGAAPAAGRYASGSLGLFGLGLMRNNKLEERVMKLTEARQANGGSRVWVRRAGGAAVLSGAVVAAGMFHLSPVLAQVDGGAGTEPVDVRQAVRPLEPLAAMSSLGSVSPLPALRAVSPVISKERMDSLPRITVTAMSRQAVPPLGPLVEVSGLRQDAPAAPKAPALPASPAAAAVPAAPATPLVSPEPAPWPVPQAAPAPAAPGAPEVAPVLAPPMVAPTPLPPLPPLELHGGFWGAGKGHPLTITKNDGGRLLVQDGHQEHRWVGADGKPFELINNQAGELTPEQKREAEAEYEREWGRAKKEIEKARKQMESPEWKAQMKELSDGKVQAELERAQKQIAEMKARMQSPEWKAQMDSLSSGKMAKEMAESQKRMAEELAKINSAEWQAKTQKQIAESMAMLQKQNFKFNFDYPEFRNSADAEKRMAEAEQRMNEAAKRLEDAAKRLEEAKQGKER